MGIKTEVDHVVWHDLLTHDATRAKHFYADLLGWKYQIEHASNFVWKPGEADYPLILANGEAHGGFVELEEDISSCWIAYVRVEDVDTVTAKARSLGAATIREPFDIAGVGRSSVIRDPQGAVICPTRPTHHFPAPRGTFLQDELITDDVESATRFYGEVFGWTFRNTDIDSDSGDIFLKRADDSDAARVVQQSSDKTGLAAWVTYLATNDVDATIANAKGLGATVGQEATDMTSGQRKALLLDPTGAIFGLLAPIKLG